MERNWKRELHSLRRHIGVLEDDLERLGRKAAERPAAKLGQVGERLRSALEDLEEQAENGWERAAEASTKAAAAGRKQIQKWPLAAVAGAVLVGVVVDRLLAGRH